MEKKMDQADWNRIKLIVLASNITLIRRASYLRKKGKTNKEIYEILSDKRTTA